MTAPVGSTDRLGRFRLRRKCEHRLAIETHQGHTRPSTSTAPGSSTPAEPPVSADRAVPRRRNPAPESLIRKRPGGSAGLGRPEVATPEVTPGPCRAHSVPNGFGTASLVPRAHMAIARSEAKASRAHPTDPLHTREVAGSKPAAPIPGNSRGIADQPAGPAPLSEALISRIGPYLGSDTPRRRPARRSPARSCGVSAML